LLLLLFFFWLGDNRNNEGCGLEISDERHSSSVRLESVK
jgi:hypothetical protein